MKPHPLLGVICLVFLAPVSTACRVRRSQLPSRSLLPRPRELAEAIADTVRSFGTGQCRILVYLVDDSGRLALDSQLRFDPDCCWVGEYAYDATRWWPVQPDRSW